MKQVIKELAGCTGEVRKEIVVERGRVDNLSGFVLLWLGNTSAKVGEVRKQMMEHREYCGVVLRELRGPAMAGLQHSRGCGRGWGAVQAGRAGAAVRPGRRAGGSCGGG